MATVSLDHNDFRTWLTSKSSEDVVGYTGDFALCPIATYIRDITNAENVSVTGWEIRIDNERIKDPPVWIDHFIARVDWLSAGDTMPVYAGEAWTILEDALADIRAGDELFDEYCDEEEE